MKALPQTGLADSTSGNRCESASPTRSTVDKSAWFLSRYCTDSVTSLLESNGVGSYQTFDTEQTPNADHRQPGLSGRPERRNERQRAPGSAASERADGAQRRRQVHRTARRRWHAARKPQHGDCSRHGRPPGSPPATAGRQSACPGSPPARSSRRAQSPGSGRPSSTVPEAKRAKRAERRSELANRPERSSSAHRGAHAVDQPEAGACPRTGSRSARVRTDVRTPRQRCCAVLMLSRWSA